MATIIPIPTDPRFKDLTGKKFGRWFVLGLTSRHRPVLWACRCDCGTERSVSGVNLKSGTSTSCGCRHAEVMRSRATHGAAGTPLYDVWSGIKARCQNPNHESFGNYGGRGITLCARWSNGENGLSGFECFVADMGIRPSPRHSIERKDNDGGYGPENCVWATRHTQARNRRNNHMVAFRGERVCLFDALRAIGLDDTTYYRRIARGWSEDRALNEPVSTRHRRKS